MKNILALGLMSGTSLDGVDASLIKTNGLNEVQVLSSLSLPYTNQEKNLLSKYPDLNLNTINKILIQSHTLITRKILEKAEISFRDIYVIGFHGQTIAHAPEKGWTWQLGNAKELSKNTGIDVVADFRSRDVHFGGEGAPLVPPYHKAIMSDKNIIRPVAILNIGGVANITWINNSGDLMAFDVGPGNGPINELVWQRLGLDMDTDGLYASKGKINFDLVKSILNDDFFNKKPPKSLDRSYFDEICVNSAINLTLEDAAATFVQVLTEGLIKCIKFFPEPPKLILVSGGGRKNKSIIKSLENLINIKVLLIDEEDYDGDSIEAEAFAYLAVRSKMGLPITWPETTGVNRAISGGYLVSASRF